MSARDRILSGLAAVGVGGGVVAALLVGVQGGPATRSTRYGRPDAGPSDSDIVVQQVRMDDAQCPSLLRRGGDNTHDYGSGPEDQAGRILRAEAASGGIISWHTNAVVVDGGPTGACDVSIWLTAEQSAGWRALLTETVDGGAPLVDVVADVAPQAAGARFAGMPSHVVESATVVDVAP